MFSGQMFSGVMIWNGTMRRIIGDRRFCPSASSMVLICSCEICPRG